jgi:hypothetical protein
MPGRFFKQHDGEFYRTKWREASIQAEGIRRDVLVVEDAPARSTVKHFSKNTDSAFFIQVAAAASLPSQLVHHSIYYSTFMPTLVTVRFGPSNGGQTTVWISLPLLTTTMRRFTNPPVLG